MSLDRLIGKNIIWTLDFCEECDRMKKNLKDRGIQFEERPLEEIMNATTCSPKAIRELIRKKFTAPVVMINGVIELS
jgi:glutaredoxin